MAIDMASVYAARYRKQPDMLRAAVMGQSPDPKLDSYTALNALRLVKEADMMDMAGKAQQPTSSPSLVAENMAPNPMQQGLGAMVPGAMGQAPQGMPPQQRAPMPQQTMQAASGGLAGMYTPEEDYAEGGIVAFKEPTEDNNYSLVRDESAPDYVFSETGPSQMRVLESEAVDRDLYNDTDGTETGFLAAQKLANRRIASLGKVERKKFDRAGFIKDYMDQVKREGGANIYDEEIARGPQDEADRAKARRVGEAGAYFTAAGKILKGRSLAEGASEALPAFGSAISEIEKLDQAAKTANSRAQFALKDAKRKERMGDLRGAAAAAELARKYEQDENKFEFDKARYGADVAVRNVQANRPLRGAGAGGASSKDFIVGPETYLAQIKEEHPEWSPAKQKAEAFKLFQQGKSAGLQGAVIKADTAREGFLLQENINVQKAMKSFLNNPKFLAADAAGEGDTAFAAELEKQRALFPKGITSPPAANPAAAPVSSSTGGGQRDYSNLWNQNPK
jgi:hypothetical protein